MEINYLKEGKNAAVYTNDSGIVVDSLIVNYDKKKNELFLSNELLFGKDIELSCSKHQIEINGKKIRYFDEIRNVCVSSDRVFVLRWNYSSIPIQKMKKNNIDAYDYEGNHLWNIGKYVTNNITPFVDIIVEKGVNLSSEKEEGLCISEDGEYLLLYRVGDIRYIFDIAAERIIQEKSGRWHTY